MKRSTASSPATEHAEFTFGSFRLTPDGTLLQQDRVVHLPPRELAALRLLLAHAGRIVTPLELKRTLWGEVHVTADSVTRCLSSLRARLKPGDYIQTVYKRGYRFSAQARQHAAAEPQGLPRLAILPFATGLHVADYLGPAIAEETITRLTGSGGLQVTVLARDSAFTLAARGLTAVEVGRKLGADLVLAGVLRALPAHLRLRVEMIRVQDGVQTWVEDMLVPRERVAGVETELSDRLAFRLGSGGLTIRAEAMEPAAGNDAQRREAYGLFQRGHHEWQSLQRHLMQDGLRHLHRATELDPTLHSAQVDLVNACVTQALYGFMSPAESARHVQRVVAAMPGDSPARTAVLPALGWVRFHWNRDLPGALEAFAQSADLPNDPWTMRARAMFSLGRHRFAEAILLMQTTLRSDPYSPWLNSRLAWAYHLAGQAEASRDQIERALERAPDHESSNLYGALILAYQDDAARAVRLAEDLTRRSPYFDLATAVHGYALAQAGRWNEARSLLEGLQWLSRERFVLSSFTPALCVALGEREMAMAALRKAAQDRCPWFFQMLADPRLEPLRANPEFRRMRRVLASMEDDASQPVGGRIQAEPQTTAFAELNR